MKAKKREGRSHSRPVRFDAQSDLVIRMVMADRQFNNYNMTVNFVIHQWGVVQDERSKARKMIEDLMKRWGYMGKDFT